LQYEGPEEVYENIEDNFVDVANCGEKCLDTRRPIEEILDQKKNNDFLKEFEEDDDKMPEMPEILNEKDFKRVMHEYIAHMEKKNEKKALNSKKLQGKKEESEEEEEEYEEEEEILDNYLKKPDLKPENVDKIKQEDMFTRKVYDKIDIKDDICLQAHMMKDSSEDEGEEIDNSIIRHDDSPTIEETSKNESGIVPKLTIIKETNLSKNSKKMKRRKNNEEIIEKTNEKTDEKTNEKTDEKMNEKTIEKTIEKTDEKTDEKNMNDVENLVKNEENLVKNEEKIEHNEIFRKREKNETAEEKAQRKAGIKAFKQDRKEKKQKFKEEFKYQHVRELKKTSHSQNIGHVSVYKL